MRTFRTVMFILAIWVIGFVVARRMLLPHDDNGEAAERLNALASRGHGQVVDLAEVRPEPWDRVCAVNSYAPDKKIDDALGFRWRGPGSPPNDGHVMLIFVEDGKGMDYARYPSRPGRPQTARFDVDGVQCFERAEARFVTDTVSTRESRVMLRPVVDRPSDP